MESVILTKNVFDPKSSEPFRLSRSQLELFMNGDEIPDVVEDCEWCAYAKAVVTLCSPSPALL